VALLKIDGKTVRKVGQAYVGGLAEGVAFSSDGRYLYVGNVVDGDVDILRLDGDTLTKAASFALPGHPASMREARHDRNSTRGHRDRCGGSRRQGDDAGPIGSCGYRVRFRS
jgi:hypothetical protein